MKPTRGESTSEIPGSGRYAAGANTSGLGHGSRHWLLALGLAGIAARLWLWWISIGSNDSVIWSSHAQHVLAEGLAHTYRKSTRLNSSHRCISYAVFCLKKKKKI